MRLTGQFVCLAALCLGVTSSAQARPPYREKMADYFGHYLPKNLNNCQACHLPDPPGAAEEDSKPHNAFGARLKVVKEDLKKSGKKADIISALEQVLQEDSDGDGVTNVLEILAGHNPGDAKDKPEEVEVAKAKKILAAFQAGGAYPPWPLFQTVKRPEVPAVKNAGWVRNPVDAFLAAEHEEHGLKPRPAAPKHVLLRRVYLDLVGLPPTREEVEAFVADTSPDAYEKVVDRLLASPRYGERWGRHWMDVWRYSDWAGYGAEVRDSHKHIWQWRDWIIESLNKDKGYDRMVLEMLAADELAPEDTDNLRATGFLVRQYYKFSRDTWLENSVEHTSKAFLGVTMNCARCHEHKFDTKISQENYYQFRAFFEPYNVRIDRLPGESDIEKAGLPRSYDAQPQAPTYLYERGNVLRPDKDRVIVPGLPAVLGGPPLKIEPVTLPLASFAPDKRPFVIKETVAASEASITRARGALDQRQRDLTEVAAPLAGIDLFPLQRTVAFQKAAAALALAESDIPLTEARHSALLAVLRAEALEDAGKKDSDEWKQSATEAGIAQRKLAVLEARRQLLVLDQSPTGAAARPAAVAALAQAETNEKQPPTASYTKRPLPTYPQTSTGRRLALARWITDRQNPLAARVAVNHIWLRHFGQGIVPSVFDFGGNGQLPTHPALLDWLAAELMDHHWQMKHIHRLLVTSSAYRMESTTDAANAAQDPDNVYYWRMNTRRMEAEVVRDSVLYLGGQLDLTTGGPDLDYNLGLILPRRSIYFRSAPEKQMEFLNTFDGPNVSECYRRTESVVPQQALALANSTLVIAQARRLSAAVTKSAGDQPASNPAFVKSAFERILGRVPTTVEQSECEKFLTEQAELLNDPKKLTRFAAGTSAPVPPSAVPHLRAREDLVHVLLNHNDFVTIR